MNDEVNKALEVINKGGVILYPTDTIWGLGCDATNEDAIAKIYKIKDRAESKSLIVLLPDAKSIFKYVGNPHPNIVEILQSFDRPTTVVYEQALGLPNNLINADGSIAIRIVNDDFCKMLLKRLKKPLVSTSANISGMPTATSFNEISSAIKNSVDYIVQHRQEEEKPAIASQIVKINDDGSLVFLRK